MDKFTVSYLAISEGDPIVLATLAHLFAVVVTLSLAFPDIDLPLVTSIRLQSIIEVGHFPPTKSAYQKDQKELHQELCPGHSDQLQERERGRNIRPPWSSNSQFVPQKSLHSCFWAIPYFADN